jgi:hypothetical protein
MTGQNQQHSEQIEHHDASVPVLPPVLRLWVRMMLALTVSVGVGLAPLLGTLSVPLFSPLLSLLPLQIQGVSITLSTAAMALVAIWVQWHATSIFGRGDLDQWFKKSILSAVAFFLLLFTANNFLVVRVSYMGGQRAVSFLKGIVRPQPDECAGLSDQNCIKDRLHFDEGSIAGYWGDSQINLARYLFVLFYTVLLSHFAVLIGLLVIRESVRWHNPVISSAAEIRKGEKRQGDLD